MSCMCGLVYQLRSDFAIFIPIVGKAMDSYEEEQGVEAAQPYFVQVQLAFQLVRVLTNGDSIRRL